MTYLKEMVFSAESELSFNEIKCRVFLASDTRSPEIQFVQAE